MIRGVAHLKAILISVHWNEGTPFRLFEILDFDFGSAIVGRRSVSGIQPTTKRVEAVAKGCLAAMGQVGDYGERASNEPCGQKMANMSNVAWLVPYHLESI